MYILDSYRKQIIDSHAVDRFCISEKPDAALIVASYGVEGRPITMARYANLREAQNVLSELFSALAGGQQCFYMPESVLYAEEPSQKDARTKRRGGS